MLIWCGVGALTLIRFVCTLSRQSWPTLMLVSPRDRRILFTALGEGDVDVTFELAEAALEYFAEGAWPLSARVAVAAAAGGDAAF